MKSFRITLGILLTILFAFASTNELYAAAKDSKKSSKKADRKSKKDKKDKNDSKKDDKAAAAKKEIDKNNPFYRDLQQIDSLQQKVAAASNENRKKRLNARIKKIQDGIKKDHDSHVSRLKKKLHQYELQLERETNEDFRKSIENNMQKIQDEISQWDDWAGVKKAAPAGKGAPAKGGAKKAAPADDDIDVPML